MAKMKSIRLCSDERSEQIRIEDIPCPQVKPGEALVKIHDAGVNAIDWQVREDYVRAARSSSTPPIVLGQDFAGEIIEVNGSNQKFKVGDFVFGFASGSYAEYAAVSTEKMVLKPKSLDFATAAALPTAGLTAYQIVMKTIPVMKDQSILIHGAAGGVGSMATQLAMWRGARVTATASGQDARYLKTIGVDRVIDYKEKRFEEKVKNMDAVIDFVGGETLRRSFNLLKAGGTLLTTTRGFLHDISAPTKNVRLIFFKINMDNSELEEVAKLVDQGILHPRVSLVMPLTLAREALDLHRLGRSHGKIVLKIA
jgi:NADPH:quinone reductase-like Zn-dependent oxidoreductase